jgi:hypothetical protein
MQLQKVDQNGQTEYGGIGPTILVNLWPLDVLGDRARQMALAVMLRFF